MNSFTFLIPSSNDSVLSAISKMLYWRSLISRIVMTCVLVGHPMVNACLTSVIVDNNSGIKMTVEVTGPKGSKNRGKEVLKMEDNSKIHEGNFTDNDEYQITVETNNIDNGSFFVMHGDSENPGHAWLEVFHGTKNIFNSTKAGDDSFKVRVGKFNNNKAGCRSLAAIFISDQ